jgi:hypothetical protein
MLEKILKTSSRFIFLLLVALSSVTLSSCQVDCKAITERARLMECNLIINDLPGAGRTFRVAGINPVTGKGEFYSDTDSWYVEFNQDIELGDTLVKRKNELKFYIHKKDTVMVFPYKCDGKVY